MRHLRSVFRRLALASVFLLVAFGTLWFFLPKPPSPMAGAGFSQCIYDRHGRLLRVGLTSDDKYRIYTPLSDISSDLIAATLLHEDQHFWHHPGINPVATLRASWHFCLGRSGRGGASTITMQLARLRLGMRTRSPAGKLRQMICALELERHYSKKEILEAYLNLAPYGGNVEGLGAASLLYFGKTPGKLTLHEAIALSVIPQSPTRRTPQSTVANSALFAAKDRIYAKLGRGESGSDFEARIEAKRTLAAPHFVMRLPADKLACTTTLDLDLQRTVERRIVNYIAARRDVGVRNAAAMLIDARRMEVLAEIGSADFFDTEISGQVDGTHSRRSPGSALKPFIFALAIDQGLIHPLSVLKDAPRSFHGYNPENFDGDFVGPITAGEALARSRNVPAVALAAQLARPTFYEFLKHGDVALPRDESYYGLSLPLGGAEVTMEEIVRLYAMLANGGRLRTLHRTLPHPATESGARLLSPEAAFLALEMIRDISPPESSAAPAEAGIYWKTGTSHVSATRGRSQFSIITSSRCGSAISTESAIQPSLDAPAQLRCSFKSSMRYGSRAVSGSHHAIPRPTRISSASNSAPSRASFPLPPAHTASQAGLFPVFRPLDHARCIAKFSSMLPRVCASLPMTARVRCGTRSMNSGRPICSRFSPRPVCRGAVRRLFCPAVKLVR
jgi:penicillin-binding protein 1C